jgi:hypothetical protein
MPEDIKDWSTTPASNDTADAGINWQEGQAPSTVNNSSRGMMAAIKKWWDENLGGLSAYASETGAADAYVIAPAPVITAYAAGQAFHFFATNANTGASTINVNALGTKAIQKNGAALTSGDIGAGDLVRVVYDGTQFQWVSLPLHLSLTTLTASGLGTFNTVTATGLGTFGTLALTTANPTILGGDTNGILYVGPSTTNALGGNILLYGDTHATQANDIYFRGGSTLQAHYDDSASLWDFQANDIATTGKVAVGSVTTPDVLLHVAKADAGLASYNGYTVASFENTSHVNIQLLSGIASVAELRFGDTAAGTRGRVVYDNSTELLELWAGGSKRVAIGTGVQVGSPTGGDYGAGTLNAVGVYDDGILLTCYVLDAEDGVLVPEEWDARVPNRTIPARTEDRERVDRDGKLVLDGEGEPILDVIEIVPRKTEVRTHEPAAAFANRAARDLDPKLYYQDMKARKALPAMPTRDEWAANGPLSSGQTIQKLWETVEVQAVHINKLLNRIEALEGV